MTDRTAKALDLLSQAEEIIGSVRSKDDDKRLRFKGTDRVVEGWTDG